MPVAVASQAAAVKSTPPGFAPAKVTLSPETIAATAFDNFAKWAGEFSRSSASVVEGQRLAWQRREAMLELIQTDPARAIAQAVPFAWRQQLPPEVTKYFEQQLDGRGDFKVAVGTDFAAGSTTTYRSVKLAGTNYQAFVYGRRLSQPCLTGMPLHGIALDGKMAVASASLRSLTPDEAAALAKQRGQGLDKICSVSSLSVNSRNHPVYAESGGGILCFCGTDHYDLVGQHWALAESGGGTAGVGDTGLAGIGPPIDDVWTHGTKSLLYMRVNFPDDLTEPISESAAYTTMASVSKFYTSVSYNLTTLDPTVTPLITLPQTKAYYSADPGLLLDDARAAAKRAGFNTSLYDRDIVTFTPVPGYGFGGLAYVGGKGVWLQSPGAGVTAHELGHNYGLFHANLWNTTTNYSRIGPGTNLEYGNIYDTMGSANAGNWQFNAAHKNKLDWLKADAVQAISSNGVYRIYPFDVPASSRVPGRFYAAAIQKDALRYYWLEFRQLFTANPWAENGLLLNWAPWGESNGGTHLIDTTPGSPDAGDAFSRDDAAIVIGRTFNDNAAGVHITPILRGANGPDPFIECQVNLGFYPGNHPPNLRVEVDATNVNVGGLIHFHAAASDADGDTLAYAWSYDDLTFSTNNSPWVAKAFSTPGDHVVRCVVSDMKGAEASANMVVTVGAAEGFRITGRVTDTNGLPLEGVLVGNGEVDASAFVGGWTDSDGRYVLVGQGGAGSTNSFNLGAFQWGYTFAGVSTWSNPQLPTNSMTGLDFLAMPLTTVTVTVDTNVVAEADGSTHFLTFTRAGDTNADFTVNLLLSGTATVGSDYTLGTDLSTGTIIIPAGTNSVAVSFKTKNDSLSEASETVSVTLLDDDANYTSPGYAVGSPGTATITILDDDSPGQPTVTVATTTPVISNDGIDFGEFVFTRNGAPQGDLIVNYSVAGTAAAGTDFLPLAGSLIIPAGQSRASVFLQPLDAHIVQSNKNVVVTLLSNPAYLQGSPVSDTITIFNQDATTVTVYPATGPAAEPAVKGAFTIERDGDLTESLVVGYYMGGTAVPGVDYIPLTGTVTIPAGAASTTILFTPIDDGVLTPDTYVTLTLTNDFNYDVGTPGSASVYITERERPTVSISAPIPTATEQGDAFGRFQITRTATTGDLTVYLALSGTATPGADYLPLDNPVVIPDGVSSVQMDVIPFHDLISEGDETVQLNILANTNYNLGSSVTAQVTITDDATSQVPGVGFCFSKSAFPEGQSPGIAVTLSTNSSMPVQVSYKVIGGSAPASRYSLPAGVLTISNVLVGFIPLSIVNDAVVEPPQTVQVVLFNPVNATLDGIKVHTYTILDDDSAAVSVTATVASASETGPVPGNFRITRSGSTNASQLVNFEITGSASAPSDYVPLGTSVTIPAGALFVDLPVIPVEDHTAELPQTVVLTLVGATNGIIASPNVATITISDNDSNALPVVSVTSTNQSYAVEGGGNGAFVFTRTGPTTNALTVSFTAGGTAAASRYLALTNNITIPVGQISFTLPLVAVDDAIVQGSQTVILSLTEGETYRTAYPSSATVVIQDNDQRVWIDASDFKAAKYGPDPGEFTFSRFGTTNTPVTIFYAISGTATNGLDYFPITNFIVIPAGQLSVALPILPIHNGIVKGPVTATLTLLTNTAYFFGKPTNATVIIDDDMPMVTIFTIVDSVLEGSSSNGVFRVTRTGDPKYDFTAFLAVGGTATYGIDYPPFATNVYFTCGVTSVDLFVTPTNEVAVEGDESVTATLLPNPSYTILSPSNAILTIADAGTNATPVVIITSPASYVVFLNQTNTGILLNAMVIDPSPTDTVTWAVVNLPDGYVFDDTNALNTGVLFTNAGAYLLRVTADNGVLQGHADLLVFVSSAVLSATNILHWPFDEGTGTNVADTSGNGRNGVFSGRPAWLTNGPIAGALKFFGTNDCVRQSAGSNTLNGLNAFTVALWVNPPTSPDQGFMTADAVSTNQTFSFATRSSASCGGSTNVVEATIPVTGGVVHRTSLSNALKPGQWQHLAVTWTNGEAPKLYINGQLDQPQASFVTASGVLTNCPQFIVGRGAFDSPASWSGGIDDVRVFAAALSAEEILSLAAATTNHAPTVDAGPDVTVPINVSISLVGTVTDDGLPNPPALVTNVWTYLGTNANVVITDPYSLSNSFVFTEAENYVFRLTASDGQLTSFDDVTVTAILPTQVDISADVSEANELGPVPGNFTVTRNGDTNELTVYLAISGTASNGVDYVTITNTVIFASGSNTVALQVMPFLDYAIEGNESVVVSILTNLAYYIGNGQATVTIHDSPYGLWSIQQFTLEQLTHPELSGPAADLDHDGIANFAEYAFNASPTVSNTPPLYQWAFELNTNDNRKHLTFIYTRWLRPRDVEYGVYVSSDLLNWNTGTNYVDEFSVVPDANNLTETVKARARAPFPGATNLFMNIRVWLQQVPVVAP